MITPPLYPPTPPQCNTSVGCFHKLLRLKNSNHLGANFYSGIEFLSTKLGDFETVNDEACTQNSFQLVRMLQSL